MKITGVVKHIGDIVTGQSSRGEWQKQEFVIEENTDRYPNSMVITIFGGDKITQAALMEGDLVEVDFDCRANEYNGRYFNNINAFSITRLSGAASQQGAQFPETSAPYSAGTQPTTGGVAEKDDDLPF